MHLWISVSGNTLLIASEKPFSPSTDAIIRSRVPLFRISVTIFRQNFELSDSPTHIPRTSFSPSKVTPMAMYTAFLTTELSFLTLKWMASRNRIA